MQTRYLILAAAFAAALVSCQKETGQDNTEAREVEMTFHATFAEAGTRTAVQEDGTSVWWTPGDKIQVFYGSLASGRFTSTNPEPAQVADFTGTMPIVTATMENGVLGSSFWGVYPYDAADTCDDEGVTLTVSGKQTGAAGTFGPGEFPSIAKSTGLDLAFYNVCGGLVFTVASEGIRSVTFEGRKSEPVAGTVRVVFNSEGLPSIESVSNEVTSVKLEAPAKGTFTPGVRYFITLLPGTFDNGYKLTFKKDDKEGTLARTSSTTINRSRFRVIENADATVQFHDIVPDPKNIVFADVVIKEALVAAFDTDDDGELSYAEAAAVTHDYWYNTEFTEALNEAKRCTRFDEFQFFTGLTEIPDGSFKGWDLLKSIVLPPQITRIGHEAFQACKSLPSITIPSSVESIGEDAFADCASLESIVVPDSVTEMGIRAFSQCVSLSSACLSDNLSTLSESAFGNCTKLSDLHLPSKLTRIGAWAFGGCVKLESVIIPQGIETIEGSAFSDCRHLREISLPEGLTSLGDRAFYGCENLRSIIIPSTLETIEYETFIYCSRLGNVELKRGLKVVGKSAFDGCIAIPSIVLPEGVTLVEDSAFYGCSSLVSVTIPRTVEEIQEAAFALCTSLRSVTLPDGMRAVSNNVFSDCTSLASVSLPDSIREIGAYAFYNCPSLRSITLPKSLVSVGGSAFQECAGLTSILIPSGVTTIGDGAFCCCPNLASVSIPSTLSVLGNYAFSSTALKSVRIPDTITDLPDALFSNCKQLEQVYFPDNLFRIGDGAFQNCESLKGITLPETLLVIDDQAFVCAGLTSVTVPKHVEYIGYGAFDCESLTEVIILPEDPPTLDNFVIQGYPHHPAFGGWSYPIYVPVGCVDTYKSAEEWDFYTDRIFSISERGH